MINLAIKLLFIIKSKRRIMKKILILMGVCTTAGISQSVNLKWDSAEQGKLDITFNNIEVLANTESPDRKCNYLGSVDCPNYPVKVLYIQ